MALRDRHVTMSDVSALYPAIAGRRIHDLADAIGGRHDASCDHRSRERKETPLSLRGPRAALLPSHTPRKSAYLTTASKTARLVCKSPLDSIRTVSLNNFLFLSLHPQSWLPTHKKETSQRSTQLSLTSPVRLPTPKARLGRREVAVVLRMYSISLISVCILFHVFNSQPCMHAEKLGTEKEGVEVKIAPETQRLNW